MITVQALAIYAMGAAIMRSVNRRDIFPALGTILLGGIATASLAKPESLSTAHAKPEGHHPDAQLIALCEQFILLQQEIDAVHAPIHSFEDEQRAQPALTAIYKREEDLFAKIITEPATSQIGIHAKARAAIAWERDSFEDDPEDYWNIRMFNSLMHDFTEKLDTRRNLF
ncbi:hypothetical protein AD940_04860 [Gluconobacter thailandicus]|uniref:hypothetical protein n=1 Tax=Gluconobacter thailandicus TaxID=257438 RepID=UPI000777A289|nr:hypothetical protein [Gluconobacter thailandicus]KXV34929.1 hypothetical protein AD940_04860 [Gluconobacter thailandicus]